MRRELDCRGFVALDIAAFLLSMPRGKMPEAAQERASHPSY
jgi:hypothetical protein